ELVPADAEPPVGLSGAVELPQLRQGLRSPSFDARSSHQLLVVAGDEGREPLLAVSVDQAGELADCRPSVRVVPRVLRGPVVAGPVEVRPVVGPRGCRLVAQQINIWLDRTRDRLNCVRRVLARVEPPHERLWAVAV